MKKTIFVFMLIIITLLVSGCSFRASSDWSNLKGAAGPAGEPGEQGPAGEPGADGSSYFQGVRAYMVGDAQVFAGNTLTVVHFDTECFDTDNMHSTDNNTDLFVINTEGYYYVNVTIDVYNSSGGIYKELYFKVNGNIVGFIDQYGSPECFLQYNAIRWFDVNDEVRVYVKSNSTASAQLLRYYESCPGITLKLIGGSAP